jgi:hypothetical protein
MKRMSKEDRAAAKIVAKYVADYRANRGLAESFPRVCVGFEKTIHGYPVRNADGGATIAYFSAHDVASRVLGELHRDWLDYQARMARRVQGS